MTVYEFVVTYARDKDDLMAGRVAAGAAHVRVAGVSPLDARLTAEQMVAAVGFEPTSIAWISPD